MKDKINPTIPETNGGEDQTPSTLSNESVTRTVLALEKTGYLKKIGLSLSVEEILARLKNPSAKSEN